MQSCVASRFSQSELMVSCLRADSEEVPSDIEWTKPDTLMFFA